MNDRLSRAEIGDQSAAACLLRASAYLAWMTRLLQPIGSMTAADLLAAISSDEPAPGAGAAGAIALALGLACARKALRITGQHHPADRLLPTVEARLAALSSEALELGDKDAQHFAGLIAAMQLPHEDKHETEARDHAKDDATRKLRANMVALLRMCDEAKAQLHSIQNDIDSVMAGDIAAAVALIDAARSIHATNLADNESNGQ